MGFVLNGKLDSGGSILVHCPLPPVSRELLEFPSYALGSAKAQALQEVDKMLQKDALELVDHLDTRARFLQLPVFSAGGVGGVVSFDLFVESEQIGHPYQVLWCLIRKGKMFFINLKGDSTPALSGQLTSDFRIGFSLASTSRGTPPVLSGLGGGHQCGEVRPQAFQHGSVSWMLTDTIQERVFLMDSWIVRFRGLVDKFLRLPVLLQRCGSSCMAHGFSGMVHSQE